MWRRRLRAKEGSQLISGQFSVPKERKRTGLKTCVRQAGGYYNYKNEGETLQNASAQDFSGDWVLDGESWVDLEM